jgi:hypothetical protein
MIHLCAQNFKWKEIIMAALKRIWRGAVALGGMLFLFLAISPASAGEVEDRIRALEETQRANAAELEKLKGEQIELKKEATAAAAAMPSFTYRPGSGLNIEAADKSWGFRASMQSQFRLEFLSGQDQVGRTQGEIMARRFRPSFLYCLNNCLWEIELQFDLDGFGTNSLFQRAAVHAHLENIHPWLPTVDFGGDVGTTIGDARRGSSDTGAQMEYDILSKNTFNTGSSGSGIAFTWDDRSLSGIGIPGRIRRFQIASVNGVGRGGDNVQTNTDKRDTVVYLGIEPFSALKNKWVRGFEFQMGAHFCNVDDRIGSGNGNCARLRLRDHGDGGRQTLFDTGSNSVGRGINTFLMPGINYRVGPYHFRAAGGFQRFEDGNNAVRAAGLGGDKKGTSFVIGHDLYVWSPKGWLTGSVTTPGSILVGTHFERNDVECKGCPATINSGQFHRNTVLLREWDLFYVLAPRMSIGGHVLWYDASNLTTAVQRNLDIRKNGSAGQGGDWVDVILSWRYTY